MDKKTIYNDLLETVKACSERGLYQSAKWAAEALNSMDLDNSDGTGESMSIDTSSTAEKPSPFKLSPEEALREQSDLPKYLLAKSYFDCKEYARAAFVLEKCTSAKSKFLKLYSKFLVGERRKEGVKEEILGPPESEKAQNEELAGIIQELEDLASSQSSDAFLCYLLGAARIRHHKGDDAFQPLLVSIRRCPYIWSAWQELSSLLTTAAMLDIISSSFHDNIMTKYFISTLNKELVGQAFQVRDLLDQVQAMFPSSLHVKAHRALVHYHAREFDEAEELFDTIIQADPYRLDELDIYSNILYVMEKPSKLAYLAHLATKIDRFRVETCCIVGNYYSLKSEHEKAVTYFRRALKINRSYLAAWTLLGHEYLELKNTHAAIEAYRKAVDLNRSDYRAWYGLGQIYEMLEMHYYALYYYEHALVYKSSDWRMWQGLANCYTKLGRRSDAIKAFTRAVLAGSTDISILVNLVSLLETEGDIKSAASFQRQIISEMTIPGTGVLGGGELTNIAAKAHIWLARMEIKNGDFGAAETHVNAVLKGHFELEEARALQREIKSYVEESWERGDNGDSSMVVHTPLKL